MLQIDVGDDGSADFEFARADVASISVDAGDGDDAVRIDDANGAFTDSIPTTIDGGDDDDTLAGGLGRRDVPRRRRGTTRSTGTGATTSR